jgi:hypothetical protein
MTMLRGLLPLLLMMPALVAFAEEGAERVLLPIALDSHDEIPGAHGSLWRAELVARNIGEQPVWVERIWYDCSGLPCGRGWVVLPGETMIVSPRGRDTSILTVGGGGDYSETPTKAEDLVFSLRVRDVSRQAETWGTEVPVVRERDLFARDLFLPNVPVTDGFRNMLRIYHMQSGDAEVLVRIYRIVGLRHPAFSYQLQPDVLLGEHLIRLVGGPEGFDVPGYAEIADLGMIAPLGDAERIVIEIQPVTPDLRYWAFVSVTNNATQHVTTVTPDRPLN